jgi:hypothetical protein
MATDFEHILKGLQEFVPLKTLPYIDYVKNFLSAFDLSDTDLIEWTQAHAVSFLSLLMTSFSYCISRNINLSTILQLSKME